MRLRIRLALAAALVSGPAAEAPAQWAYPGSAPYGYGPVYAFKDESLISINNSYLGYGNLVYQGPHPPAPGYATGYVAPPRRYVVTPPPAPVWRAPRRARVWRAYGR
jgi:hypothetical protein